jgi:hypothetical protein
MRSSAKGMHSPHKPTSHAAMSGGWAVPGGKTSEAWCGPERSDYTARRFPPKGLGLDGQGVADPAFQKSSQPKAVSWKRKQRRMGGSAAETIRQPGDRLKGQPQEREHSDLSLTRNPGVRCALALSTQVSDRARGIDCPRRGVPNPLARRIVTRMGRDALAALAPRA